MKNYKFKLIVFVLVTFLSCGNEDDEIDCTLALPEPNWFEIGFYNSQGDPLIGSAYQQESFRLFNNDIELNISPMPFGDPTRLLVRYDDIVTDTDFYIELTATDNDTLNFSFNSFQGDCFLHYNLQQVIYNGEEIQLQNSSHVSLIK